jgi:glucoamylase
MALLLQSNPAPGGPGATPTWTRGDKDGVGTARSLSSSVWFTAAGGIITEVYYPDVDTPQIKDLQFIITDGVSFFHDPKVDFDHACEPIVADAPGLRLINTAKNKPYRVIQEVITEPGSPVLLIRTSLETTAGAAAGLLDSLRVYVLLAPHLEGFGASNDGYVARTAKSDKLVAHRGNTWLALVPDCGLGTTSCGFSGVNDGWQDIIGHQRLPVWNFDCALQGTIALTGEISRGNSNQFVLGLAFGTGDSATPNGALVALSEALSYPFGDVGGPLEPYTHLPNFLDGWAQSNRKRWVPKPDPSSDGLRLYNFSRNVLLTHEDKIYNGALVASLSLPWGELAGDSNGGYHMVWPRDMSQSATALLASGETDLPLRGLMYLAASQSQDGSFFQKFYIDGAPFPGSNQQLDEYSFPIMLAYRMWERSLLQQFDPRPMVLRAAGALVADGPMTQQERWEEDEGYSPSTLAANIAALICAAEFADQTPADHATAEFLRQYADFLEAHLEAWTVTDAGTLLPGIKKHYIRILPTQVKSGDRNPSLPEDPNNATVYIRNRSGQSAFPAKEIVDGGFLELVRYGIRKPGDPLMEDSLKVLDAVIKYVLPQGPCWLRYNNDGYGQRDDGTAFQGTGVGRPWPLLAGERAHYELACGRDVSAYLKFLEDIAGPRGLLPEQVWSGPNVQAPSGLLLTKGGPTGSAMPLAWAHAEYIRLVRSASDKKVFDLLKPVADRYLPDHTASLLEVWNFDRQLPAMPKGRTLRIPLRNSFRLTWSVDNWKTVNESDSMATAVGIQYADIPTTAATPGPVKFTFYWVDAGHWEGVNYQVNLT